ncbi:DNA-3-methyladenine glycosylase II [Paenibacillus mucilaginosus 3016]|uniref:DNA-3-methyladenine glycosylase II n=1 Tax=Paenibacillus mucilaginosus 3016 TaxID=1116391 RepID=H6NG00_9BACL|nr:DNA-3-methyladenine glycosylase [Paenibacillus mucilaginosus]AFC31419.1 DNA-3-methyladenine glycosylase II [Paenibacillus mucilaginosus 3016]WFA19968.1 DNA-3-methyladenine glycosylase 2 family protein [Paenibacillus mucilaginosus]
MPLQDTHALTFSLTVPPDFRFAPCLDYMARSDNESLFEVRDGGVNRLLLLSGEPVLLRITAEEEQTLTVRVLAGAWKGEAARVEAERYIRDWFDLDRDLEPFYRLAMGHGVLGGLAREFNGLRLVGVPDLFEALCWAIVGQQVNLAFAYTLKRRLTETYGDSLEWEGRIYRHFPRPGQLAAAEPEALGALQLTRMKSAAVLDVARRMSGGALSREGLLALGSFRAAEEQLLQIRGVGPWTSQYVRMRCLRDPEAYPVGDVGLHNAVRLLLGLDRKPTLPELQALFADWPGWEAYAAFYLWRALY